MKIDILSLPDGSFQWGIVDDFLRLRKEAFIDRLEWPLIEDDGREFDQYDAGGRAVYVICSANGDKVIAGCRLLPCNLRVDFEKTGISYMLRDAYLGRIDIPNQVWTIGEPPTDAATWELTRLVSRAGAPEAAQFVLEASWKYLKLKGAVACLGLSPPAMIRKMKSLGADVSYCGPTIGEKNNRFRAYSVKM